MSCLELQASLPLRVYLPFMIVYLFECHCISELAYQCRKHKRGGFDPWIGATPWREGMGMHSSILAWRIPRTEEPSRLQSIVSQKSQTQLKQLSTHVFIKWKLLCAGHWHTYIFLNIIPFLYWWWQSWNQVGLGRLETKSLWGSRARRPFCPPFLVGKTPAIIIFHEFQTLDLNNCQSRED